MAIVWFIIGTFLGSFYLVIGTRLPKGEDVVFSRSHCDKCKKELKWYNLIPLFSYAIQGGKCSFCHEKISSDHFWIEISTGLLFLITYFYFPFGYNFLVGLIISSLLIVIFVSDFKYMIILDSPLIVSTLLMVILKFVYFDYIDVIKSLISGIILVGVMLAIRAIGNYLFKKDSLGGGDIKFSFVIGTILGLKLGLVSLLLSTFLALPYALTAMYFNKDSEFPYGPFLVGALFIVFYHYDKFVLLFEFLFPI